MEDGTCMILHYSNHEFGQLMKTSSIKMRFYDWESIFDTVPPGFGQALDANYASIRTAIRQFVESLGSSLLVSS
jgi:hypothetical protein